jgi:hypothetical protein
MSTEQSKENASVFMTEEEYFNKVSAAQNDPQKLDELMALDVQFKGKGEVNASLPEPKEPETPEEGGQVQEEVGGEETAAEEQAKEIGAKEQPFSTDATAPSKDASSPKKSDEVAKATSSLDQSGKTGGELEALKKERDEWKHKFTSNAGRIAAYQKTIADLKARIALLEGNGRQSKPADKEGVATKSKVREHPTLKKMADADPVLAEMVAELLETQEASLRSEFEGSLQDTQKVVHDTQAREFVLQEAGRLREAVTNLDEVIQSREYNYFYNEVATPGVRSLLDSEFADDALEGLRIYAQWCDAVLSKQGKQNPPEAPAKTNPDPEASKVLEARSRRLQGKEVNSAQSIPKGSGQFDPDKYFDAVYNETLKSLIPARR